MELKPQTKTDGTKTAEARADQLIAQAKASSLAAEAIQKASSSSREEVNSLNQIRNVQKQGFGYLDSRSENYHSTTDQQFKQNAYQDKILGPQGLNKETRNKQHQDYESTATDPRANIRRLTRRKLGGQKLPHSFSRAKTLVARTRASAINVGSLAWQVPVYILQLMMATISALALGSAFGFESITEAEISDGIISWAIGSILEVVNTVAGLVGIDFVAVFFGLFALTYMVVLVIGYCSLFGMWGSYKAAFLHPLSGRASGLKLGLYLLAFIGYATPLANMFPFILPWMGAVWFYPR